MSVQYSKYRLFYLIFLSNISVSALAQSSFFSYQQYQYPEAVERYLKGLFAEERQKYTFHDDYPGGFEAWQAQVRPELRRLIGLNTIAVPSCSFSVLTSPEGYIYHCDCNAVPGILQWGNLYDVAGLIAPRYLLTVNGLKDKLHSVDDINRAAGRVQAIYQAAGVAQNYDNRWGKEGHRFYKHLMWPFIMGALEK